MNFADCISITHLIFLWALGIEPENCIHEEEKEEEQEEKKEEEKEEENHVKRNSNSLITLKTKRNDRKDE